MTAEQAVEDFISTEATFGRPFPTILYVGAKKPAPVAADDDFLF